MTDQKYDQAEITKKQISHSTDDFNILYSLSVCESECVAIGMVGERINISCYFWLLFAFLRHSYQSTMFTVGEMPTMWQL